MYLKKGQPIFVVTVHEEGRKDFDFRVSCAFLSMELAIARVNSEAAYYEDRGYETYSYDFEGRDKFVCRMASGAERDPDTDQLDINMADRYVDIVASICPIDDRM